MKTRVVQLITFEIESQMHEAMTREDEVDRICEKAAEDLCFRVGDDGLDVSRGVHLKSEAAGSMVLVTIAKVSSDELTLILADRRRLHAENARLRNQIEVLKTWIRQTFPIGGDVEIIDTVDALDLNPVSEDHAAAPDLFATKILDDKLARAQMQYRASQDRLIGGDSERDDSEETQG